MCVCVVRTPVQYSVRQFTTVSQSNPAFSESQSQPEVRAKGILWYFLGMHIVLHVKVAFQIPSRMLECFKALMASHSLASPFRLFGQLLITPASIITSGSYCVKQLLEKTLESPLDCKEIQPIHPKGDRSWVFSGRTDAEAETPVLCPPPAKSWLIGKDPDAGRDWGQEEKGTTEDEMAGWHHWLNGREFEWTPGVGDGQGGLAGRFWDSWGCKESNTTERLNWTELK